MSDTESTTVARGAHSGLPILTEENFADWDMQITAYLTGSQDHACVITPTRETNGTSQDPIPPTTADATTATTEEIKAANAEIALWQKSERVVLGCLMATAGKLHRKAILKRWQGGDAVYKLYSKICAYHQQCDASQQHEAWMQFLALRKSPSESYTSIYRCVEVGYDKIDHITPASQSMEECGRELILFTLLSALPHDDTLRTSLTTQKDLTLADAAAALLRFDTGKKLTDSGVEQAHAAFNGCWACGDKEHIQRDCPHREAIQQFVTKQKNRGNGGNNGNSSYGKYRKGKGKSNAKANTADATNTNATDTNGADRTHETAGVATLLLSNKSHVTDIWLCDTGASSSMSGDRSVF